MKRAVVITGGGTVEPIDGVRSITNTGTGLLGSLLCDEAAAQGFFDEIIYLHGPGAILPKDPGIRSISITTAGHLLEEMERVCRQNAPAAIIHSMAVSDYTVASVVSLEDLRDCRSDSPEEMAQELESRDLRAAFHKIPSTLSSPLILLRPTPKVIASLRKMALQAILVGFKLLDTVSHEELMKIAAGQIQKNDCDYVLANDYDTIRRGCHEGYLLGRNGEEQHFIGKEGIARGIMKTIREDLS